MRTTNCQRMLLVLVVLLPALACRSSNGPKIRRNRDGQDLYSYHLQSATGARNGDKLTSELVFTSADSALTMQMRFQIGVPTRLESGTYSWRQGKDTTRGSVTASSVIFLGGQDGAPSLGGNFQLVSEDISLYEVMLPTTVLATAPVRPSDPAAPPPPSK